MSENPDNEPISDFVDIREKNRRKIDAAFLELKSPIKKDNPAELREQIAITYSYANDLTYILPLAEEQYRLEQGKAAKGIAMNLKGDKVELVTNGETAHARKVRDIIKGLLDSANGKLSAQKCILNSFNKAEY